MRKEDRTGSQVHKSVFLHLMIAACNVIYPQFFFSTRDNQLIDVMYKTLLDPNSIDGGCFRNWHEFKSGKSARNWKQQHPFKIPISTVNKKFL